MDFFLTTLLLMIIIVLSSFQFWIHKSRRGRFVDEIPGPRCIPVLGNIMDLIKSPEELWDFFRKCAVEYKSIYKFWIGHWSVINLCCPDDIEVLLNSQKNISKSLFYDFLHPWLNTGLLTSTGNKWRNRRKILTPAFHFNVLKEYVDVFIENSVRMIDTIKNENREVVLDLIPFVAKFSLSAICESAMGTVMEDHDSVVKEYSDAVKRMGDITYHRSTRPWLSNDWIFSLTPLGRELAKVLKILHNFTERIIKSRKKYHEESGWKYLRKFSSLDMEKIVDEKISSYDIPIKKKRLAMLDLLIAVQKNSHDIDDLGIREEVDTFIFEGYDTTDVAISFALLLLAEHKDIQARARAEFDTMIKESGGKLGINEAQSLPYLERCIKESLRLYPSVPIISREITSDLYLKKYMVPRGSIVNIQIFDVHRNPNYWPEPNVYDPDRFLPENKKNRHPFSFIPFSGGARNCIGQKFGMLEAKIYIGQLLHNFNLEPVIEVSKVRFVPDLVLKSLNPLNVKFIPIS